MLVFIPTRACFWLTKVDIFRRSSLLQQFTAVVQREWHSLPFLCWFVIVSVIPVYTYVSPLHSGSFVAYSSVTLVSFRFIAVSFQLVPVYSGTILVHSVSFRGHSASFRYILFRSIPFLCLVTPKKLWLQFPSQKLLYLHTHHFLVKMRERLPTALKYEYPWFSQPLAEPSYKSFLSVLAAMSNWVASPPLRRTTSSCLWINTPAAHW